MNTLACGAVRAQLRWPDTEILAVADDIAVTFTGPPEQKTAMGNLSIERPQACLEQRGLHSPLLAKGPVRRSNEVNSVRLTADAS